MQNEYSVQRLVSDGTLSTVVLGIPYLERNDIYMRVAGEETPPSGAPSGYTWYFVDDSTLRITPTVPSGVEVVVYRRTDVDAMYNVYSQNAQFDEATIDENNTQLLYLCQEYFEQGATIGIDTIEFLRDDGSFTYYRIKRTDGSYSDEFYVPSAGSITKVLARESLRRSYAEAGYNLVGGSFEQGGTLNSATDALLHEAMVEAYSWGGTFPKVVAPGTDPAAVGSGYVQRTDALLRNQLAGVGPTDGAAMVRDKTRGVSVQDTLDASSDGYEIDNDGLLSESSLTANPLYKLFKPLAVSDTDGQGVKVPSDTTVINEYNNRNEISTTQNQSALRIDGDNILLRGVKGVGTATPTNSATSEFITTRMAWASSKTVSDLWVEGVIAEGFTTGVGLYGVNGAVVKDSKFTRMQYSPSTLNSAGGYGVLIADGQDVTVSGCKFVATVNDRHAVYVSVNQGYTPPAVGWSNVKVSDNEYDWTATDVLNDDSKLPFVVRAGNGLVIENNRGEGGSKCVGFLNSDGPISNIEIKGNTVKGIKPKNGLPGCFVSTLSAAANGYQVSDLTLDNNTFSVIRDPSTTGLDQAARLIKVNNLVITRNKHTLDTGVGYLIQDCNNVFIDDNVEIITDTTTANTVGARMFDFEGSCSNITIGTNKTNRLARADGKSNLIYGLQNCTDVTCRFERYIEFTVTNGVVSLVDDAYDIILPGGVTFGTSSIVIAFRAHVTQAATVTCSPYSRTANNVSLTKAVVGTKSITIALLNCSTGAAQPVSSFTARVGVTFFS